MSSRLNISLLLIACALGALSAAPAVAQASAPATQLSQIHIPALRPFKPEQPKRIDLQNGAVIFLIEDHELPLIGFTAQFRGGSRDEPATKVGLAEIFGEAWRTGGTTAKTGDQIDDLLEARAARLETASGIESSVISGDCLKQDFNTVFDQMLEFIHSPAFREDKIALAKQQLDAGISRRNDSAASIAQRESVMIAYGKSNPYARIAEYATVGAITRADLVNWHKQYIVPNNMIFGIAGDFNATEMEARLRKAFGPLPKGPQYQAPKVAFQDPKPGVYFIEKDDVNQSQIRMVALGTERKNPDYFALQVMNEAFAAGGFSSRLISRIRTAQGLAYSVGGAYGAGWDHPGIFDIETSTKSGSTAQTIQAIYNEVDNAVKEPFTAQEVNTAKDAVLNAFVFRYDSKEKLLRERMTLQFYGYPQDFIERYHDAIEKMTPEQVNAVARKYINRTKLAVLVVGNSKEFDKSLATFGAVTPVDIAIPEPAEAAATGTAERPKQSTPEGKALLARALAFYGGPQKLSDVKSISYNYSVKTAEGIEIHAESAAVLPDRVRQTMMTPGGQMTAIISPAGSFMQSGANSGPMPKTTAEIFLNGIRRTPYFIAHHSADPAYIFTVDGAKAVGGKQAQVLAVAGGGQEFRWLVDPQTGEVLGSEYRGTGQEGPVTREETYTAYKSISGVQVPFSISVTQDGKPAANTTIDDYKINPAIAQNSFDPPATPGGSK